MRFDTVNVNFLHKLLLKQNKNSTGTNTSTQKQLIKKIYFLNLLIILAVYNFGNISEPKLKLKFYKAEYSTHFFIIFTE